MIFDGCLSPTKVRYPTAQTIPGTIQSRFSFDLKLNENVWAMLTKLSQGMYVGEKMHSTVGLACA
jgi:hypothetical protein